MATTSGRILRLERLYGHYDASPREPLVPLVGFCAALGFWWQAFSAPGLTSGAIDKDVRDLIPSIPLLDSTGRRKQMTPVADIQTVLRVIVQLPCRGLPCYYHLTTGWLPADYRLAII